MNELGMTVAWLTIQVTLLGLPSLALHALATRRGPTSGAWVAGLSLGLVVVLSVSALITGQGRGGRMLAEAGTRAVLARASGAIPGPPPGAIGHSGMVAADGPAAGRLAFVERPRATRGARTRARSHHSGRLRGGPAGSARRGAELLSPGGPLDRRTASVAAGAGGRRLGCSVRGGSGALPCGPVASAPRAGLAVPVLAGDGVPPVARDP